MQRLISYTLVAVQFLCLIYLAVTGPVLAEGLPLVLEILGGALGVWAMLAMRLPHVRIAPDVRPNAELVARGPYRWIRHPMYAAVLLVALALVLNAPFPPGRWAALGVLTVDLVVKLHYEERLLRAALPDYAAYTARTKRLIPFVY